MGKLIVLMFFMMITLFFTGCETEVTHKYRVLYFDNAPYGMEVTGDSVVDNTSYTSGMKATVLENTFVIEGYKFVNWNTSPQAPANSPTAIAEGAKIEIRHNYVWLFAIWEKD